MASEEMSERSAPTPLFPAKTLSATKLDLFWVSVDDVRNQGCAVRSHCIWASRDGAQRNSRRDVHVGALPETNQHQQPTHTVPLFAQKPRDVLVETGRRVN